MTTQNQVYYKTDIAIRQRRRLINQNLFEGRNLHSKTLHVEKESRSLIKESLIKKRLKTRKPSLPVRKTEDLQYIGILAAIVASFRRIFQCNQRDQIITIIP